jgi:hypothetical protein
MAGLPFWYQPITSIGLHVGSRGSVESARITLVGGEYMCYLCCQVMRGEYSLQVASNARDE